MAEQLRVQIQKIGAGPAVMFVNEIVDLSTLDSVDEIKQEVALLITQQFKEEYSKMRHDPDAKYQAVRDAIGAP